MKKLLFFLSLLLFCGVFVYADVPKKLNVQGKLTSDSGQVLAEKSITSAILHLRPAGSSTPDNEIDTQTGATDSNGLYSLNFNVTNFNFDAGSDFKVVITVDGQSIPTDWASIATNPYSFYSSTATYAISAGTATYAVSAGTATYAVSAGTATYATTIADGSVTTLKIVNENVTPAKLTQSDYANVYKIKVDTATYAVNATTATFVIGAGLPDGSVTATKIATDAVTTIKILNANVTPAKLTQSDYVNVYKIKVDTATYAVNATTADALSSSFKLVDGNFTAGHIYTSTSAYATNAGIATTATTANALSSSFKLVDGNFTAGHIYTSTSAYATNAGIATTATTANALSSSFKLVDGNFTAGHVYTSTSAYATNAGIATIAEDLSDGIIETSHFKYTGPSYAETYNIKVATAVYAETGGADLAEIYASTELLVPGDVVSIDTSKDNSIVKTKVAEDTLVAGVISTKPGLLMNKTEKGYELALVGKVPTKVCNEGGSIKRGDLLVSASIAGYAKKASDNPKTGTVIGKALENFDSVTGTILVLVNLQ